MPMRAKTDRMQRLAEAARAFRATRRAMRQFIRRGQIERLDAVQLLLNQRITHPNNRFNQDDRFVDLS